MIFNSTKLKFFLCIFMILSNSILLAGPPDGRAQYDGEGMPSVVGQQQYAVQYLQEFLDTFNIKVTKKIFEPDQEKGASYFKSPSPLGLELNEVWKISGNKIGLGLRFYNDTESIFKYIAGDSKVSSTFDNQTKYTSNGVYVNNVNYHLRNFTQNYGCIPKLNIAGHGWASLDKPEKDGGPDGNGIYGFTINDMQNMYTDIQYGKTRFCNRCLIQIHACNIATKTASYLARLTGCQVVAPTGKISTFSKKYSNHWFIDKAIPQLEWGRESMFRVTPIFDTGYGYSGIKEFRGYVKENLGVRYISY